MRFVLWILAMSLINACTLLAQVTGLSGWNIFLDPGHSQKENMGIYNYSEAEKNLRVAFSLRDMLLKTTDIDTVYLSRTNDTQQVSLNQRTDYANSVGAAWFHSLHSDADGPENTSTLLLWGQYYNKVEKVPNGGKAMADIMVNILTRGMRTNTRGSIGDCTFYSYTGKCTADWHGPYLHVNRKSNMPSELSEAGFHTNPTQNQLNMNAEWKKLQAKTFCWSILKFHNIVRPAERIVAGIITNNETGVPVNGARVTLMDGKTYITDSFQSLFYHYTNDPELLHNGFYYFDNLPAGTLEMMIEADGYYSDTLQVIPVDTFFTFKDVKLISKVPPYIVSTTPAEGDTNFPAWNEIVITFSRAMNQASVQNNFIVTPEAEGTLSWSVDKKKLIFHSDSLEFEMSYAIRIFGAATDMYGHLFDGNADGIGGDDFTLHFKTGPQDMMAPKLLAIYPPKNSSNIELQPIINATFDEPIDSTSITADKFKLERATDQSGVPGILDHYVVNKQSVFCFFPTAKLFSNESYIIRIYPGLYDLFGNKIPTIKTSNFRSSNEDDEITKIDDFESNTLSNWRAPQQSDSTTGIITEKTNRNADGNFLNLLTDSKISLQINYGWDLNANEWLIRVYLNDEASPKTVHFDTSYIMQIYIFGDGSGNKFRFCVDDRVAVASASNPEVSPWFTIDWLGWKLVSWDLMKDGTGTWLGDGNLDGTLRFDSIQLTYHPGSPAIGILYFDDLRIVKKVAASVVHKESPLPNEFKLCQNYPNPFNAETVISYQLSGIQNHVCLEIYDLLGHKVKTLIDKIQPAGVYVVNWEGKNEKGQNVASGIYICKLLVGKFSESKRMLLVR